MRLLRVHHTQLRQWFIVSLAPTSDRTGPITIYADLDADGRISRRDSVPTDQYAAVDAAARYFSDHFEIPIPGVPSQDQELVAGGLLNAREATAFEAGPPGVLARRPDLLGHLDFFDRRSGDGVIGLGENYLGWRDLGFGRLKSLAQAIGSGVVFGGLGQGLAIDIERIALRRPRAPSGIYDKDGNVDPLRLEQLAAIFDGRPVLTHEELRAGLAARTHLGTVPKRQFDSLCALSATANGAATITRWQFLGLFDNSLFWAAVSMPHRGGARRL